MSRFDRYVLSQLLMLFGFFSLVLVSVFWLNRAVRLFDQLIADGHSTRLFFELSVLSLPNVIRLALPMSTFAAAVYVANRMTNDSELTVVQAMGTSPLRLIRPVFWFGLIVAVMMSLLTHYLGPASLERLTVRKAEIQQNIGSRMLSEGTFLHPTDGVTFYIREITPGGELRDVLLSDMRRADRSLLYTAAQAYLLREGDRLKLVMVDGLTQVHDIGPDQLLTTYFTDFTYDISSFIDDSIDVAQGPRAYPTHVLISRPAEVAEATGLSLGKIHAELSGRFTQPAICLIAALIGYATLLLGTYSRFGVWRQIVLAFGLIVLLELVRGVITGTVRADAQFWPLLYLPVLLGSGLVAAILTLASRPLLLRSLTRRRGVAA